MRMKKLLMFLVLLTVSVGTWAFKHNYPSFGVSFDDTPHLNTQTINITSTTPGALKNWWDYQKVNQPEHGKDHFEIPNNLTKLVITGTMNADDFSVLSVLQESTWANITTVDLSQVTVTNASDVCSMNLTHAETVVLPNGFNKQQVNTAGVYFTSKNQNFGSCLSANPEMEEQEQTKNWYEDPCGNKVEYTGTVTNGTGTVENITRPLTFNSSSFTYVNTKFRDEVTTCSESEVENGKIVPNPLKVELTQKNLYTYNGETYDPSDGNVSWWLGPDGVVISQYGPHQLPVGTQLDAITTYTYTWRDNHQNEGTYTYNGQPQGNATDGYYAMIENRYTPKEGYQFDVTPTYTYTYINLDCEEALISYHEEKETIDLPFNQTVDITTTSETILVPKEGGTIDVVAYVNTAGSLYKATNLAELDASKIETVVISGNVTVDDITQMPADHLDPLDPDLSPAPPTGEEKFTKADANPAWYINNVGAAIKDMDLSSATIDNPVYLRTLSANMALERIVFPENLTRIPYACCYANGTSGNYNLSEIVFPQGLQQIGAYAFHGVAITDLYVKRNTTSIGYEAFGVCPNLEHLVFEKGITDLSYDGYVFDSCPSLKHITFPEGVTKIGNYIFNMCTALESIHLPSSLQEIGDGAFHECISLNTLVIPENVHTIGRQALSLCYITDLFLMAEDVEHLPAIYSSGSDFGTGTSSFARNQLDGNNTGLPQDYDTYLTYTSEQMLQLYRNFSVGNTVTNLHYSPNLKDFIDANPYYNHPDYQVNQNEKPHLSDTYLFVDSEGNTWPSKDSNHWVNGQQVDARGDGNFVGDYARCGFAGDPTNYQSTDETAWNYSPYATTTLDEPSKLAWRQFVLRRGDAHDETVIIYKNYKDVWYTFCTPFDMTDEMLAIAFNENFNICEFDAVEVKDESIILHFNTIATSVYKDQDNVVYEDQGNDNDGYHIFTLNGDTYTHVTGVASINTNTYAKDGNKENGVKFIEGYLASAYHPYMIHPNYGTSELKKRAITGTYKTEEQIDANTALSSTEELNTVSQAVRQTVSYNGINGNFYFIGNVEDPEETVAEGETRNVFSGDITAGKMVKTITGGESVVLGDKLIPQYAYFLGTAAGQTYPKYWKETAPNDRTSGGVWTQYSAIIISDQLVEKALGRATNLQDDNPIKALEIDFSKFIPEDATAIEQIVEEAKANDVPVQFMNIVYDFNGNIVKKGDTSLENLPGGMYIINGKKYLVK